MEEKEESAIHRFLMLQFENPAKGDWASSCIQDLEDLGINLSLNEIKNLSKYTYSKLITLAIKSIVIYITLVNDTQIHYIK